MYGVRSRIRLALEEDVVVPVFLFYCNKGRHRSVATATVVGHIPKEVGVHVMRVHLAESYWFKGACGGCSECNGTSELKDRALNQAFAMRQR